MQVAYFYFEHLSKRLLYEIASNFLEKNAWFCIINQTKSELMALEIKLKEN